jgi:hypothetical protein
MLQDCIFTSKSSIDQLQQNSICGICHAIFATNHVQKQMKSIFVTIV